MWADALTELAKPEPRLVVHHHDCSPELVGLIPQLRRLNATLRAKGCRGLHLATVIREPVSIVESFAHWSGQLAPGIAAKHYEAIRRVRSRGVCPKEAWHVINKYLGGPYCTRDECRSA